MNFIDPQLAFERCFKTDNEREQYMYMYSEGNVHYFKHINTREYLKIEKELNTND
jgi:hypothetical protein